MVHCFSVIGHLDVSEKCVDDQDDFHNSNGFCSPLRARHNREKKKKLDGKLCQSNKIATKIKDCYAEPVDLTFRDGNVESQRKQKANIKV